MGKKTINELNEVYREADECDKDLRAEQRTNIQLVAGDHYNRQGSRYWNRIREAKQIAPEQRIRLTKNHIAKITKIYRNAIQTHSPGVTIIPKNETELQDQKAAELHSLVWEDIKDRHNINKKIRTWVKDFIEIGEVICKVFWDPNAGVQVGWQAAVDELGEPVVDPMTGEYTQSETPVMSGDLVFETIHGFDLRRDPTAKSMEESQFVILQKMVPIKDLKKKYEGDEEKEKFLKESDQDTFRVFEGGTGNYKKTKDLVHVREFYYRPCADYPKGYFFITTELGILEEGELPFGVWPIIYEGFDEITTSPRCHSIIKQLRPYQIEINRAASKIAEHQLTVGDDKVFLLSGSKPSSGAVRPGVRYESITGQPPIVVPGRAGDQYIPYLEKQIEEMYKVSDVFEELEEKANQLDPHSLLYRSLKQKKEILPIR